MSSSKLDDSDRSFQEEMSTYKANSKIMLTTVISFAIIIIFIFVYYLYARFVLRHRRSAFQNFTIIISQPPKHGLDSLAISSLPMFVVGVKDVNVVAKECAVCLSLLEVKDMARMLPDCKHVFHVSCVDKWLKTCSTCPICRTDVDPRPRVLEPEPREGPFGEVAPPLDFPAAASSHDEKTTGSSDSVRMILMTREGSSNNTYHSCVDQDHVVDLDRQ